jgi:phage terminase Nu1 subunit (DNA packaging protein)
MELTKEQQVAQDYKAALDSVALLQAGQPKDMTDSDWENCKQRNIDHLKIQIAKGAEYYGTNDLTPFENAIK